MRKYLPHKSHNMIEVISSMKLSTFLPGFLGGMLAGLINHNSTRECIILMVIGSIASYAITPIILQYGFAPEWATGVGVMIGYLARPVLEEAQRRLPKQIIDKVEQQTR